MELSEVFYEAACRISNDETADVFSCLAVKEVDPTAEEQYAVLMANPTCSGWACAACVENNADELGWDHRDFRTFMLLMASEAVK